MRYICFVPALFAMVLVACSQTAISKSGTEPKAEAKLERLSSEELEQTFSDLGGSPDQVSQQAGLGGTGNEAGMFFQDMGREGNLGGAHISLEDGAPSGLFLRGGHVNYSQDIGGRFSGSTDTEQERIHRAGWIKLDVKKAIRYATELRRLAANFQATVTSFKSNEVTWKMPASNLETLLAYFEKREDTELLGYDFRQYDRTGDFYAIDARSKTLTFMREYLLKLAEKAEKLEDLLKVQEALEQNMVNLDRLNAAAKEIERRAGKVEVRIVLED